MPPTASAHATSGQGLGDELGDNLSVITRTRTDAHGLSAGVRRGNSHVACSPFYARNLANTLLTTAVENCGQQWT